MAKIKPLRQTPLFRDFPDRDIAVFARIVDEVSLTKNQSPTKPYGFIFLRSGKMHVDAKPFSQKISSGEHLGELALLAPDSEVGGYSIVCEEDCEFFQIQPKRFWELAKRDPEVSMRVVSVLAKCVAERVLSAGRMLKDLQRK